MTIVHDILTAADRFADRPALEVGNEVLTYQQLLARASSYERALREHDELPPLVGVMASRSIPAYAGILGILLRGRGYMPLNAAFPVERCRVMLQQAKTDTVIVGAENLEYLKSLLSGYSSPLHIFMEGDVKTLATDFPHHCFHSVQNSSVMPSPPSNLTREDLAYVLFTSGSTGIPKGVQISHANLKTYTDSIGELYSVAEADRFSQVHELTFDPSAHDMFSCWSRGAALCVLPKSALLSPAAFIREKRLSMWFSVPSVAGFALRLRTLPAGSLPTLRVSLFCGEPLPVATALAWQKAAPNSRVDNLYGPTEATVSFTYYTVNGTTEAESRHQIVPIGKAFPGQSTLVVNEQFEVVAPGEPGELLLSGSQVSPGYWQDPIKNAERFVCADNRGPWYRTGDLVEERDGCLFFLGRADFQVKVRGYRVELQEVEAVIGSESGIDETVVLPWPVSNGSAEGLVAFVASATRDQKDLEEAVKISCKRRLPDYMVPTRTIKIDQIPLNVNGKVDRHELARRLEKAS